MTTIPDDIMQAARKLLDTLQWDIDSEDADRERIARALLAERLAERERCAQRLDDEAFALEDRARAMRARGDQFANYGLPIARALRDQATAIRGQT